MWMRDFTHHSYWFGMVTACLQGIHAQKAKVGQLHSQAMCDCVSWVMGQTFLISLADMNFYELPWKEVGRQKIFSFLPNILLLNINAAEGLGMTPNRDTLEIRSLL